MSNIRTLRSVRAMLRPDPFCLLLVLMVLGGCSRAPANTFRSDWPEGVERIWVGPDFWANRLADWRLEDGRAVCLNGARNAPVRTLHLLTRSLRTEPAGFGLSVVTAPVESDLPAAEAAWTGFLIGGGGPQVDYRLTAQTHLTPAEDGGLLAVIDGEGRLALRDFSGGVGSGGLWSISGPLDTTRVPILAPAAARGPGLPEGFREPVRLDLFARPEGDGTTHTITLRARDPLTRVLISQIVVEGVPAHMVDGGIALVSHLGSQGGGSGFWFDDLLVSGSKVLAHPERAFGPVLTVQYTLSRGVLTLTAQLPPLGEDDPRPVRLEVQDARSGDWRTAATSEWVTDAYTATFQVTGWDAALATPFRVVYELRTGPGTTRPTSYEGLVPAEPTGDEFVVAAFTGNKIYTGGLKWNHQGLWFPAADVVRAVRSHDPDLLFFSGDQIYEGDLTPAVSAPDEAAILDYLYKWYRWCWSFSELTRTLPAVTVPDDHDVFHGNVWGAGGKKAEAYDGVTAQDSGGYRMSPRFVNMVHRTQTSHLPAPWDPTPAGQGISVYYTDLRYGGVSFAVLADRMWKDSPTMAVPAGRFVNGWSQAPGFDPARQADVPGAELLGRRQEAFLAAWAEDWSDDTWMKVVLSQTLFANVATLPAGATSGEVLPTLPIPEPGEYPAGYHLAADGDSNGWPQSARDRAVRLLRQAFSVHLCGDQHLASTVQYGVEEWRDAGFALCVPSVGNTWPRRWFPPAAGRDRSPEAPVYTGDFRDGFGNRMTVLAVANPRRTGREPAGLYDRAPGYGIARFDRRTREVSLAAWPRWIDPTAPGAAPYEGWPVRFNQLEGRGRATGWLPELRFDGIVDPVVKIVDERSGETVYTLRVTGPAFRPPVYRSGTYTVRVGEPGTDRMRELTGLTPGPAESTRSIVVSFTAGGH